MTYPCVKRLHIHLLLDNEQTIKKHIAYVPFYLKDKGFICYFNYKEQLINGIEIHNQRKHPLKCSGYSTLPPFLMLLVRRVGSTMFSGPCPLHRYRHLVLNIVMN